jgi:hypothetical protein
LKTCWALHHLNEGLPEGSLSGFDHCCDQRDQMDLRFMTALQQMPADGETVSGRLKEAFALRRRTAIFRMSDLISTAHSQFWERSVAEIASHQG